MCRVAVRNTTRARPAEAAPPQNGGEGLLYDPLAGLPEAKNELDFQQLFAGADEVDLDAG